MYRKCILIAANKLIQKNKLLFNNHRLLSIHTDEIKLFDRDTAITCVNESNHDFKGMLTNNWSIGDAPNGGYLMSIAISAARKVINFRDPLSITAYYMNKSLEHTELDINVNVLNTSKGSATVSISFKQLGILRSQYIGTFGNLNKMQGLNYNNIKAPILPPIEDCIDCSFLLKQISGDMLRIVSNATFLASPTDPFVIGCLDRKPVQDSSLTCWVRFEDGRLPCLRSSSFFLDAFPPPILNQTVSNWVPTFEYNVHFWRRPVITNTNHSNNNTINHISTATNHNTSSSSSSSITSKDKSYHWLRCRFHTPIVINGMLYTDGELWSEDGIMLLATSRQLARVLTAKQ